MSKQPNTVFLEDYLRANSDGSTTVTSPPSSARAIIQAWAELRDCLNHQSFQPDHLQSLKTLISSQTSLHVADPQAKLLLSILSLETLSLPPESFPLFLRLLYIWVRKSFRPSSQVLDSAVEVVVSRALTSCKIDHFLFSEAVLLLGAFSLTPPVSERSKVVSLERLVKVLEEGFPLMGLDGRFRVIPNVLAGIGYALSSPLNVNYNKILSFMLGVWQFEGLSDGSVPLGLMILHLVEWVVSGYIKTNFSEKISVFSREVLETPSVDFVAFAVLMGAAGVLRACNRVASSGRRSETISSLRISAENRIEILATELISRTGTFGNSSLYDPLHRDRLLLQCLAVASARSGLISPSGSLLLCLTSAILNEVFPLIRLYAKILEIPLGNSNVVGLEEIKGHLDSIIFKDAGAITGVFCNQYSSAEEENKKVVENFLWNYCREIYLGHRRATLFLNGRVRNLLSDLEKIAESAFLMVVVFALGVTKQKLNNKYPEETQREVSLRILVSFSCVEYFRRMRLAEYMDTIRGVVACVQESEISCVSFIKSIPSYGDLTKGPECSFLEGRYDWCQDEMQTARILFYLRVIPTLIEKLPSSVFSNTMAPTMFLYMSHPSGKLSRASHSLFATFISSGEDSVEDERATLKEQLAFYYVERSLVGFPFVTPFEGMAPGIAALVRHLPAGSPAIFYCIHSLVEKANRLCKEVFDQESSAWKTWQGETVHCKMILELLVHLLSLVDIQVLPELMKLLAQQVVELPKDGQNMVLSDLYSQVADSDDVTRKPTLVSWLQSLSYLCSQSMKLSGGVNKHKPPSSLQTDPVERASRL